MFQTRTGLVSGVLLMLALTAQPLAAHADEQLAPVVQTQEVSPNSAKTKKVYSPEGVQAWAKAQTAPQEIVTFVEDVEVATERLQDRLAPTGRSLKAKIPSFGLASLVDRTVTVFGLLLKAL